MLNRLAILALALATPLAFAAKGEKEDKARAESASKERVVTPPRTPSSSPESPRTSGWGRAQGNAATPAPAVGSNSGNTHAASSPSTDLPQVRSSSGRVHEATPVGSPSASWSSEDEDSDRRSHRGDHFEDCGHRYSDGGWIYVREGDSYDAYGYDYRGDSDDYRPAAPVDPNGVPGLDLGIGVGFNAPAGAVGLELEWRPFSGLGVGLHGGVGAWGKRLSPILRVYPMGARHGLFLEGAISVNEGGTSELLGFYRTVRLEQTETATLALGLRQTHSQNLFTSVKAGYQWNTRLDGGYSASTSLDSSERFLFDMLQPGGLVVAATIGVSF